MPVKSLMTFLANAANIGSTTEVRGHACSGDRTIDSVEISIDFGATWMKANPDAAVNSGARH